MRRPLSPLEVTKMNKQIDERFEEMKQPSVEEQLPKYHIGDSVVVQSNTDEQKKLLGIIVGADLVHKNGRFGEWYYLISAKNLNTEESHFGYENEINVLLSTQQAQMREEIKKMPIYPHDTEAIDSPQYSERLIRKEDVLAILKEEDE